MQRRLKTIFLYVIALKLAKIRDLQSTIFMLNLFKAYMGSGSCQSITKMKVEIP